MVTGLYKPHYLYSFMRPSYPRVTGDSDTDYAFSIVGDVFGNDNLHVRRLKGELLKTARR